MTDINRFKKTNKMIVNGQEVVYDEIRDGEFKKVYKPIMLDGNIQVGKEVVDSFEKQTHLYLNGVKVCTDIEDKLGNNRHYQELRVFLFTTDDGSEVEVTNFSEWQPDTDECVVWQCQHINNTKLHVMSINWNRHGGLSNTEARDEILKECRDKNAACIEMANALGVAVTEVKFSYDPGRKLLLSVEGISQQDKDTAIAAVANKLGHSNFEIA